MTAGTVWICQWRVGPQTLTEFYDTEADALAHAARLDHGVQVVVYEAPGEYRDWEEAI